MKEPERVVSVVGQVSACSHAHQLTAAGDARSRLSQDQASQNPTMDWGWGVKPHPYKEILALDGFWKNDSMLSLGVTDVPLDGLRPVHVLTALKGLSEWGQG